MSNYQYSVLDFSLNDFKGPGFEPLENCKALQQLYLAGNQITSLVSLPELPNLEKASQASKDDVGLDADNCKVLVNIEQQSPDIAQGVHGHLTKRPEEVGVGDQGHMFGYATNETPELMPLRHVLATKLGAHLTEVRKNGTCAWLRPDVKTQVTVEYHNDNGAMVPIRVYTILISTQHDETVTNDEIAADLKEHVIKPVVPEKYLDEKTIFHLNPSGRFVIGGPHGDAGQWTCTQIPDIEILKIVKESFDFRPGMISIRWCHDIGREHAANKPLLKTVFQVMMQLFSPRKTTLLFVIRHKTKVVFKHVYEDQASVNVEWAKKWQKNSCN
ncbi:hypothetical protein POM88_041879 [Heracleum sosnowskyi]|uniref:methionine adenosyltransferase n=1 Tax=Heracleum sosnowskyi TaxID=360622 RepID=A0AAD8MBQ9_9APIA|nr:hypothetical protein POM88_041879 [Heracleum sosnowskyi]